jgi:hypothetical protein
MTKRFLSHSPEERAALLNTKQERFLENLAKAMGPDPDSNTPRRFHQRRGQGPCRADRQGGGSKA